MKIATIIGTRPQFIKAAPVSRHLKRIKEINEIIIHTGQHYEKNMSDIFFKQLDIKKPNYNLDINQADYSIMIEKMVASLVKILIPQKIDGVLVYGDTNSTLAGSLAAKKINIPLFHVEAGLRSNNRNMLEEGNRIITDHLSALLFCPTRTAVKNLSNEKIKKGVIFSGDVMYDSFLKFFISKENFLKNQINGKYILSTIHRRENIQSKSKLISIFNALESINEQVKVIMPVHPHTKKQLKKFKIISNIGFIEPLDYFSMLSLLKSCEMVITDSGGFQKESFFEKKKCIILRAETEWVELIKNGTSILSNSDNLLDDFKKLTNQNCKFSGNIFGSGNASECIAESIKAYLQK